jgi:hypothetical protein
MKKIYSNLLLAAAMCCLPLLTYAQFAGGTGTPDDPYQITTAAQLRAIGENGASPAAYYSACYVLMNDIDFADVTDWLPIGVTPSTQANPAETCTFMGTFDGKGHKLSNITVVNTGKGFTSALFVKLGGTVGATVKDLVLENVSITGGFITGGLAGTAFVNAASGSVEIQNVSVSGTISGTGEVGGITGRINNSNPVIFKNCHVNATITGTDAVAIGGIANDVSAVNVGGIVGSAFNGQKITIENCLVQGGITASTASGKTVNQGGLIGLANSALAVITLNNSVVAAELFGDGGTNAFWGSNEAKLPANPGYSTIHVNSCYALEGALTAQDGGTLVPVGDLKSAALYAGLNWDPAVWKITEGAFPILQIAADSGTGVNVVDANQAWSAFGAKNSIEVSASQPLFVSVYDITGKAVFAGAVEGAVSIPANQGIYILKAEKDVKKVIVK